MSVPERAGASSSPVRPQSLLGVAAPLSPLAPPVGRPSGRRHPQWDEGPRQREALWRATVLNYWSKVSAGCSWHRWDSQCKRRTELETAEASQTSQSLLGLEGEAWGSRFEGSQGWEVGQSPGQEREERGQKVGSLSRYGRSVGAHFLLRCRISVDIFGDRAVRSPRAVPVVLSTLTEVEVRGV